MDISKDIRKTIDYKKIKIGFLTHENKCFSGEDLQNWILTNIPKADDKLVETISQDLIQNSLIYCVSDKNESSVIESKYYKFQADSTNISANMIQICTQEQENPISLSVDLVKLMNIVLVEFNEKNDSGIDLTNEFLEECQNWIHYTDTTCHLQGVNLKKIPKKEQKAFFLNIFQVKINLCLKFNKNEYLIKKKKKNT